ncbi:MAG: ribonucleotide-diphosphate reductase subunit beta [Aquificae bacterium]|nr:ribonucleotide-diphosphate reductase subunit beta [Aquificota bacterium]
MNGHFKQKPLLFNPEGNDFGNHLTPVKFFDSPLWKEPTGLFTIFHPNHPYIYEFVKLQKQRLWKADEYPIDRTREQFDQLDDIDRKVFEYTLSFLAFLDSVQVSNLTDIETVYNMPEYKIWGATHKYFEVEHSIAYSNILYGLFNQNFEEVRRIFYLAKDHPELRRRNELIAQSYQKLFDLLWEGLKNVGPEEYARTLTHVFAGTYAMEAVTFYMGFKTIEFYQYKYGILPMTNKMISEIKADELFHVKVMASVIKTLKPYITRYIPEYEFDEIVVETVRSYAEADLQFYQAVLAQNNFGITQKQVENYIKFLTDRRLKLLGLKPIYGVDENPFEEIDRLYGYLESHVNEGKKEAFFETKSSAYLAAELDDRVLETFEF